MGRRDADREPVTVDGACGDADQARAAARPGKLGVALVDVAEKVDVGAALHPAVRVALIGEPAFAEGVMGEDEGELVFGEGRESLGDSTATEAELALVDVI